MVGPPSRLHSGRAGDFPMAMGALKIPSRRPPPENHFSRKCHEFMQLYDLAFKQFCTNLEFTSQHFLLRLIVTHKLPYVSILRPMDFQGQRRDGT